MFAGLPATLAPNVAGGFNIRPHGHPMGPVELRLPNSVQDSSSDVIQYIMDAGLKGQGQGHLRMNMFS